MTEQEIQYTVKDYEKPVVVNPFTPFVEQVLLTLPADKSVEFEPFATEKEARETLRLLQQASRSTDVVAKKRAFYMNDNGKWVLEVGTIPRKPRKTRAPKK